MRSPRLLKTLLEGGTGAAAAVLAPRAASLGVQWLLVLAAGPAALAAFVTMTSRGAVAVSLVAAGLAPTLMQRPRALGTRGGRALVGGALLALAVVAIAATGAYETTLGLGGRSALVIAAFSGCALFASTAPALWPMWQMEGRYLYVLAAMLACSPGSASLAALAGRPALACLASGLAGATPGLLLLRPTGIRRAFRYAAVLVRRAVPLSLASFATAVVFPAALSAGTAALGSHAVGQQALYWSFMVALSIASQSFASRALAGARDASLGDTGSRARALRSWLRAALALALLAGILYGVFAIPIPGLRWSGEARAAMTPTMLVSGVAPLMTDPLCFYFSDPRSRRVLVAGSMVSSAAVAVCLALAPSAFVRHFGVIGPSAIVGVLRLGFVRGASVQAAARVVMVLLLAAYAALLLGTGALRGR